MQKPFKYLFSERGHMSKLLTGVFLAILFYPGLISAQRAKIPVESGAAFSPGLTPSIIQTMANMVRAQGYQCDSVSAIRKHILSSGYTVNCNRYNYTYGLADRGGNWIVTVE